MIPRQRGIKTRIRGKEQPLQGQGTGLYIVSLPRAFVGPANNASDASGSGNMSENPLMSKEIKNYDSYKDSTYSRGFFA